MKQHHLYFLIKTFSYSVGYKSYWRFVLRRDDGLEIIVFEPRFHKLKEKWRVVSWSIKEQEWSC